MMLKADGAMVAILMVSVAVVAVGMWQGFIPVLGRLLSLLAGAKEPEHSARYYPPDTLAYAWATLLPSGGQSDDMRDVWQRFNDYPRSSTVFGRIGGRKHLQRFVQKDGADVSLTW